MLPPNPAPLRPAGSPLHARPEIRSISFSTATLRSGRVVVAKIDCSGLRPEDIECTVARAGFTAEILPDRTRQGRYVYVAVRIHREPCATRGLCLLRFSAGPASLLSSLTVLS
ncbi:hypothetical protein OEB96_30950 [Paraliomyxa miuraensis]|nr:hypothetical protein [Paraliomyxa miuraensis]